MRDAPGNLLVPHRAVLSHGTKPQPNPTKQSQQAPSTILLLLSEAPPFAATALSSLQSKDQAILYSKVFLELAQEWNKLSLEVKGDADPNHALPHALLPTV